MVLGPTESGYPTTTATGVGSYIYGILGTLGMDGTLGTLGMVEKKHAKHAKHAKDVVCRAWHG